MPGYDRALFRIGRHRHVQRWLGAHATDGGVRFMVWAPGAVRVSVVGDFNRWDHEADPLAGPGDDGIWCGRVAAARPGMRYKYAITGALGRTHLKADPYAQEAEPPPRTASVVPTPSTHAWGDADWMRARRARDRYRTPLSIYEVHAGSWRRDAQGRPPDYRTLARWLVPYVRTLGFTHIELMPLTEHPFGGSWGYQATGYFAPTRRYGQPDDLRWFVDHCHRHGIGVLLDWCPAHFPADDHALARFDGAALYEHPDPRLGTHPDWRSLVFDLGRPQVRNLLVASALHWLQDFHFDGLRVDAVASMLYLDYSRAPGDWLPNPHGGHENLDAIAFLRELNDAVAAEVPDALMIAEESTAWPGVTARTGEGGLGFGFKWNMGWMNDTLAYLRVDPLFRNHHHHQLTFAALYAHTERFVLPLSHDEVVHGKGALARKGWGCREDALAQLRLLLAFQWSWPGAKLLFMGGELGQADEWNHDGQLAWHLLDAPAHQGMGRLVADLNRAYRTLPALHRLDHAHGGFAWLDCHDADGSTLAFLRRGDDASLVIAVFNFLPVERRHHRVGVPLPGHYRECINTDSCFYGGGNRGNHGGTDSLGRPHHGQPDSIELTLPPLGALLLSHAAPPRDPAS